MKQAQVIKKSPSFYEFYERRPGTDKVTTHYCPGCGHGNLHKLIAEAIDELEIQDRTILVNPVGCAVFAYYYFDVGNIQAPHGRAPAVATGIKRAHPDSIVISYQGDGDLAAIGGNEILHAANRGENITVFFLNNAIYGMTGGQMAPTTLSGQKTITTPQGRDPKYEGYPIRVSELLSTLEAPVYIERVALTDVKNINKAKKSVLKALKIQIENKGFSLVEILSPCPVHWKMEPVDARKWIGNVMEKYFPLGVFKDITDKAEPKFYPKREFDSKKVKTALELDTVEEVEINKTVTNEKYKNPEFIIAGFGGQGVLFMGIVLAETGMLEKYQVSWLPSYGPETRGGTANCHVRISDKQIGSPLISKPTVLIMMNRPSLDKFESSLIEGGLLLYDSSLVDRKPNREDIEVLAVPATKLADEVGSTKVANVVMLGAYIGYTNILSKESVLSAFSQVNVKESFLEINRKALQVGMDYVK
jgi:2-oxoisovalerate ferredoxin oxidoreductase beta subunit